jgi:hypothetical protein
MIGFKTKGDLSKTSSFLKRIMGKNYLSKLDKYGKIGTERLAQYTPVDTGLTASSWKYEVEHRENGVAVVWSNTNVNKHVNIALILQYGHGTRNGGYVEGRDYINPALKPIFDDLAKEAWEVVVSESYS